MKYFYRYKPLQSTHLLMCSLMMGALIICLSSTVNADDSVYRYHLSSVGDQGSVNLSITNTTTSFKTFSFGPKHGTPLEHILEPFESTHYLVQCHKRNQLQSYPELSLSLEREEKWLPPFVVRANDPKNVIWIEADRKFKQSLDSLFVATIKKIHTYAPISINASVFPTHLSSLMRASLIMTSLKTFSSLTEERRQVIKMVVAAGATLVIGTGEMGGDDKVLEGFSSVALGEVKSNSGALLENMMRVPSYRTLYIRGDVYPLVMADDAPILVENRLGMGKVRVLAVKMNTLTPGPISEATLAIDERPQRQLYQWLDMSMPPLTAPSHLLTNRFWLLLLLIPLLFWTTRNRLIMMVGVMVIWIFFAILGPPLHEATLINRAHQLYIPMDKGALVLGQVDISSFTQGARAQLAHPMQFGLLSTETEGACLVHDLKKNHRHSWWILESDVGERQRFKYVAYVESVPRDHKSLTSKRIPDWPKGPWSGVVLQPLSPILLDLPLPSDLDQLHAWRLPSTPPFVPPQPLMLIDTEGE